MVVNFSRRYFEKWKKILVGAVCLFDFNRKGLEMEKNDWIDWNFVFLCIYTAFVAWLLLR